jgi:hypothetical protein
MMAAGKTQGFFSFRDGMLVRLGKLEAIAGVSYTEWQ